MNLAIVPVLRRTLADGGPRHATGRGRHRGIACGVFKLSASAIVPSPTQASGHIDKRLPQGTKPPKHTGHLAAHRVFVMFGSELNRYYQYHKKDQSHREESHLVVGLGLECDNSYFPFGLSSG